MSKSNTEYSADAQITLNPSGVAIPPAVIDFGKRYLQDLCGVPVVYVGPKNHRKIIFNTRPDSNGKIIVDLEDMEREMRRHEEEMEKYETARRIIIDSLKPRHAVILKVPLGYERFGREYLISIAKPVEETDLVSSAKDPNELKNLGNYFNALYPGTIVLLSPTKEDQRKLDLVNINILPTKKEIPGLYFEQDGFEKFRRNCDADRHTILELLEEIEE